MDIYLQIHLSYKFELGKDCGERLVCSIRPPRWFKIERSSSLLKECDILLRLDHIQFWTKKINILFFHWSLSCVAGCTWRKKSFFFHLLKFLLWTHLLRMNIGHPSIVMLNLISVDISTAIVTDPPWETESLAVRWSLRRTQRSPVGLLSSKLLVYMLKNAKIMTVGEYLNGFCHYMVNYVGIV